jgi:amino acid transporter
MSHDPARPTATPALQGDAALLRAVGSLALTAAVINIIVGGGIFKMPAALSSQVGAAAPLALVAGALVMVPIALCFAAIGSRASATGGPYTYVSTVFGTLPGFLAGALMWICNVASSAGVAAALSLQVASLLPVFAEPVPRAALLVGVYALMYALNAFGVKLGARAITVLAALKLTPLFLLVAVGVFFVDWGQVSFRIGDVPSWTALGSAMVMVVFAYSGIETALIPGGELRDPSRSVPRAATVAILLVVLLYLGLQIVTQGLLGPALATSSVPIADTAARLWSPAHVLLLATACISMAGFLLGNLLGSSRLLFALGRDGYLPSAWARVSARHHVPLLALATHAAVALTLAIVGSFETLVLISGGAVCLVYVMVCVAAWRAQKIDLRERGAPFVLKGGPLVPLVAVVGMLAILATLTQREWLAIGVAVAVLAVVYAVLVGLRRRVGA